MHARLRTLLLVSSSLVFVGLLGYGVGAARAGEGEAPARPPNVFGGTGPLGQPGSGVPAGLPPLPPGVTVDANGVIKGIDRTTAPGTKALEWDTLRAYAYSQAVGLTGLPEDVQAVDGRRVTMVGFLQPLYEFEDIHQFALVGSHWSCCFGQSPGINGVVNVTLAEGRPGLANTMEPLRVVGTFRARETKEEGWLISIFSIDDAEVEPLR